MAKAQSSIVQRLKEYFGHLARSGDMFAQAIFAIAGSRVMELGGPIAAPTTPSTQATGAAGALALRVNMPWYLAAIDGAVGEVQAVTDFVVFSGASPVPNGSAVTAAVVAKRAANGTFSNVGVMGVPAVGVTAPAPTDAAIQAAIGAGADWVRVGEVTFARTGDINTFTQTPNMVNSGLGLVLNTPGVL